MTDFRKQNRTELEGQLDTLLAERKEPAGEEDPRRLLEELQIHQIELELQNRELRETRSELERSRDRYADLYDFAPVGYLTLDQRGQVLEVNLTGARMLGIERSNVIGTPLARFVVSGQLTDFFRHLKTVFGERPGKQVTELEVKPRHRDPLYVRLESIAVDSEDEGVVCRTVMLDVTERKRAEDALHQAYGELEDKVRQRTAELAAANESLRVSQAQLQALLNNTSALVCLKDTEGRYLLTNRRYQALIGRTSEDLSGKTDHDLFSADIADEFRAHDNEVLNGGVSIAFEETLCLQGQEYVFISVRFPLLDGSGTAHALGSISTDITERVRIEQALRASEARLARAQALSHVGSLDWVPQTGEQIWSDETFRIFGFEPRSFAPNFDVFLTCIHTDDRAEVQKHLEGSPGGGAIPELEFRILRPDREERVVRSQGEVVSGSDGDSRRVICTLQDITERKRIDESLQQAAAVFEHTDQGIIITDASYNITAVNPAFTRITGYGPEEVTGRNPRFLYSERDDGEFYRGLWRELQANGHWQGEIRNRDKSGREHPVWESITEVHDDRGRVTNYVAVFSDISVIKEAEAGLQYLAHHDPLTDVPNRLLFDARLENAIQRAKRHGANVALMFIDLDRFKITNDTLGHLAGDLLLKTVARRLQAGLRAEDTVARLGGDEFAVVLDEITRPEDAARLADKLLDSISVPIPFEDQEIVTSASIGISIFPGDADGSQGLRAAADTALYRAKQRGRGNYQFYAGELSAKALDRRTLEAALREALAADQFVLYYQPQVSVDTGRIVGVEALLRWRHPSLGMVLPDQFLPTAEQSGLIDPITDWVLRSACAQAVAWQNAGLPALRMSVNLSTHTLFHDSDIVARVQAALTECELSPRRLEIEISEKALQNEPQSLETLRGLKGLGVTIAVDDFGTGYSSLSLLKWLPLDALKIDRAFLLDLSQLPNNAAVCAAVIAMGHSLNLRVVAEGVTADTTLEFLREKGCDEVQGYFFSQPVLPNGIAALLSDMH